MAVGLRFDRAALLAPPDGHRLVVERLEHPDDRFGSGPEEFSDFAFEGVLGLPSARLGSVGRRGLQALVEPARTVGELREG